MSGIVVGTFRVSGDVLEWWLYERQYKAQRGRIAGQKPAMGDRRLRERGRSPVWRRFSNLRVHGTFLSRVPIGRATVLTLSPANPNHVSPRGANPTTTGKQGTRDRKVPCPRRQESRRYDFRLPRQATWPQRPHVSASGDGPGPGRRSGGALCQTVSNRVKPLFRNLSSQFVKIRVNLLAKTFGAYSRKLSDFAVESSGFRSADFIWVGQPMSNPP